MTAISNTLADLQARLGYQFTSSELLLQALTHRSCGHINNERLEFIGDSMLNMVAAILLFESFPNLKEGDMSRSRAALVRQETLVGIGNVLGLAQHLNIDTRAGNASLQPSMVADAVEAIFGAIYLDAGINAVMQVIRRLLIERINSRSVQFKKDAKTSLQEWLQSRGHPLPAYELDRSKTERTGTSTATCTISKLSIKTVGKGPTKQAAEMEAARKALELCHRA